MRLHNHHQEQKRPDPGCLACRDRRGRIVLVDRQGQRDSSVVPLQPLPSRCAAFGKLPESIFEAIKPYKEDRASHPEVHQGADG